MMICAALQDASMIGRVDTVEVEDTAMIIIEAVPPPLAMTIETAVHMADAVMTITLAESIATHLAVTAIVAIVEVIVEVIAVVIVAGVILAETPAVKSVTTAMTAVLVVEGAITGEMEVAQAMLATMGLLGMLLASHTEVESMTTVPMIGMPVDKLRLLICPGAERSAN
jgi:hypothetical protein